MNIVYTNKKPIDFDKILEIEEEIYRKQIISLKTKPILFSVVNILDRKKQLIIDRTYNMPQNIFLASPYDGHIIVGRKIRSDLHIQKKINAINCSKITASMLLGILKDIKKDRLRIEISYYPFLEEEKLFIFNEISKNQLLNIEFPFRYKNFYTGKEKESPSDGWSLNKEKVIYLGNGEEHIRRYTIDYIYSNKILRDGDVIFDPACSTGQFLYEIKEKFPNCKTVGQDLSKEMVKYASNYVDEVCQGDAILPFVKKNSVDILLLRFLNSEVTSTCKAYRLFNVLLHTVKDKGLIFCFGHTPVLIRLKYFQKKTIVIRTNGYDDVTDSMFQYYVLRKLSY